MRGEPECPCEAREVIAAARADCSAVMASRLGGATVPIAPVLIGEEDDEVGLVMVLPWHFQ